MQPGGQVGTDRVATNPTQMDAHPQVRPARGAARLVGIVVRCLAVSALGLAFFLAPALQGINLEADQSVGGNSATRAADRAAAQEALRLAGD